VNPALSSNEDKPRKSWMNPALSKEILRVVEVLNICLFGNKKGEKAG